MNITRNSSDDVTPSTDDTLTLVRLMRINGPFRCELFRSESIFVDILMFNEVVYNNVVDLFTDSLGSFIFGAGFILVPHSSSNTAGRKEFIYFR